MAVGAATPVPIASSEHEIRVSTRSVWSDRIWQLDVSVPGTVRSDLAIDWGIALADGSSFTMPNGRPGASQHGAFFGHCVWRRRPADAAPGTLRS